MKKLVLPPWLDALFNWGLTGLILFLLLTRFVFPRPSESIDPHWKIAADRPTLLEFSAPHCPACLLMEPVMGQIEQRYRGKAGIRILSLDTREGRELADRFGVRLTPTFLVADRSGAVRARFQGTTSYLSLTRALDEALRERSNP